MILIHKNSSGACAGRSTQQTYRSRGSSSASISAVYLKSNRSPRYWWLVLRPDDIEVCLKAPARNTDVIIAADLMTFTKVWLGYVGLAAALESRKVSLNGPTRAISITRRLLALH